MREKRCKLKIKEQKIKENIKNDNKENNKEDNKEDILIEPCNKMDPEDKSKKSKIHLQLISSFIVNLALFSAGISVGWPTIAVPKLENESSSNIHISQNDGILIINAIPVGAIVGSILSGLLLNVVGRKWFLYATSAPFIICWLLTYFANSWIEILIARLISGVSVGALYSMAPLYIGELVEPRIRGASNAMLSFMFNLGCMFVFGLQPILSKEILSFINLIPIVIFLLTMPWLPESPYYYCKKNKIESAAITLVWLRRKEDNKEELKEINELISTENQDGFKKFGKAPYGKALMLLLLLMAAQQLSGFAAILFNSGELIKKFNVQFEQNYLLLIISAISLVASLLSALTVDKIGRKSVFLISTYGTVLCLLVIGAYFFVEHIGIKVNSYSTIPLVAFAIYFITFSYGLTSIPYIVSSEIFLTNMKNWATMFSNIFGFILFIIVYNVYRVLSDKYGYVIFLVFGAIEFLIGIILNIALPETSSKSFNQIQNILKG
ncbi:facilitated trehalose transporter Tret1-like isoform X3 [Apis cerana]|uniref:facilitated trehalose transporter Tret1-like isoform X3 n=1 Tax=Apis cerana TaxID=7461 RepID=UPI0007E2BDC7|nr:facilitated trehalose transporter Tret1-like isoform X3 [Apis cerana]XP_061939609.1 facilitated trehalose transporter Tret1-like isoform X3 [Apis cerana]XP_061939613.1 facilitated trehalose transporter Tret1-like isoform X3 [Apis cerana]